MIARPKSCLDLPSTRNEPLNVVEDGLRFMTMGMQAIAQDEFTKCFTPRPRTAFQHPLLLKFLSFDLNDHPMQGHIIPYLLGMLVRYGVLFPIKFSILMWSFMVFALAMPLLLILNSNAIKKRFFVWCAKMWMLSLFTRVRYHGTKPKLGEPHVFVANHTTFFDFVVLSAHELPHAIIAQHHGGIFGYIQKFVLAQMGSLTFDRNEKRDRARMTRKLKSHVKEHFDIAPILIFPEGTCVNNECTVLFHQGAFSLSVPVCPVAIKYDKRDLDPYWNTRQDSFMQHIAYLMTRWRVTLDVWWLPPQIIHTSDGSCNTEFTSETPESASETPIEFANRVKALISETAGLKNLSWDGYLKNVLERSQHVKLQRISQQSYAESLSSRLQSQNVDFTTDDSLSREYSAPLVYRRRMHRAMSESFATLVHFPKTISDTDITDIKNKLLQAQRSLDDKDINYNAKDVNTCNVLQFDYLAVTSWKALCDKGNLDPLQARRVENASWRRFHHQRSILI